LYPYDRGVKLDALVDEDEMVGAGGVKEVGISGLTGVVLDFGVCGASTGVLEVVQVVLADGTS
jgi:hypothetical protein